MGVATTLPAEQFAPFFDSLRNAGYRGATGLIIADYSPAEAERVSALADIVWNLDESSDETPSRRAQVALRTLRFLKGQKGLRRAYAPSFGAVSRMSGERRSQARWELLEGRLNGLQSLRYGLYFEFLHRYAPEAESILLSDLRDVVFQGDPFETPVGPLELYLEDKSSRIEDDEFNSRWIQKLYGAAEFERMRRFEISCSGTVVGRRAPVLRYLHHMDRAISGRRISLGPHDQGVHNYLIRQGLFPEADLLHNGEGRVVTMGRMPAPAVVDGRVTVDATTPPVLHQYDRFPALAAELSCLWSPRKSSE